MLAQNNENNLGQKRIDYLVYEKFDFGRILNWSLRCVTTMDLKVMVNF